MTAELLQPRPVTDADSDAIIELIGGIWSSYPGVELHVDEEEPWMRAPASYYAEHGGRFWVAGEPVRATVGIREVFGEDDVYELKSLYVHPSLRRQRLGHRLVQLVEQTAREWGARRLVLWSDTKFVEAHAFYDSIGYRRTGRARDLHDRSSTTELEFELAL